MNKLLEYIRKIKSVDANILGFVIKNIKFKMKRKNIIVHNNTIIKGLRNIDTQEGKLRIGLSDIGFLNKHDRCYLNIRGKLIIKGNVRIDKGSRLDIGPNAICILDSCSIGSFVKIIIQHHLEINKNSAVSWDCQILDEDFHQMLSNGCPFHKKEKSIKIEENVWIGCNSKIFKGIKIGKNSVIAAGSIVFNNVSKSTLVAGNPAKVIMKYISWK